MADRGVSEVVGFVLIFSLITLSVGAVYAVGFTGLQDARDAEQLNNVERAFDVLDDNMADIVENDAPNRATEFRLYEADMTVGEPTRITVNIDGSPDSYSVAAYPLVYQAQGSPTSFRYVGGAVIREDRNGAIFLNEPSFLLRESGGTRTAVIPLIETRSQGSQAVGGTGTVLIRANRVLAETLTARTGSNTDIELTVESTPTRAPLWAAYLNNKIGDAYGIQPCTASGDTVTCDAFTVQRLYVTATRIDVSIDG